MRINNIKKFAVDFIVNQDNESFELLIQKVKRYRCNYAYKLYADLKETKIIRKEWDDLKGDIGAYLELAFIEKFNNYLGLDFHLYKINETKSNTVDFLIKNRLGEVISLCECTTFDITNIDTVKLLNNHLCDVIKTPASLIPEFNIPNSYLTIMLGYTGLLKKIKEKVNCQFNTYMENHSQYKSAIKFILMDLSWFIFDNRVNNSDLLRIIRWWKECYQFGTDVNQQNKIIQIIEELRTCLRIYDISLILLISPIRYSTDNLVIVNQHGIYLQPLTNLLSKEVETHYELFSFEQSVVYGYCENNLFYTYKMKICCPRFEKFIYEFIKDYFKLTLNNNIEFSDWEIKIQNEIIWFNNLRIKYLVNNLINASNSNEQLINSICIGQHYNKYTIVDLINGLHYIYEQLFYILKLKDLIGYNGTYYAIVISFGKEFFETICNELNNNIQEYSFMYSNIVSKLNINKFNNIVTNPHYKIQFDFI